MFKPELNVKVNQTLKIILGNVSEHGATVKMKRNKNDFSDFI